MVTAIEGMGDARPMLSKLGFTNSMLGLIGGIAVLASNTEHWTEQAIWRIEGIEPAGARPSTDSKQMSDLIKQLGHSGAKLADSQLDALIQTWCGAAKPAFRCRNSIFHGATIRLGDTPWFASNARWHQEIRKRPFSDFHADDNTLQLLHGAFGVLLRTIVMIAAPSNGSISAMDLGEALAALSTAASVGSELENLAAAMNHEKY